MTRRFDKQEDHAVEKINTIVVGGGQAGLATSYCLSQQGIEHLVLEQSDRPAPVWRDGRWDSLTLVTPNRAFRMPGAEYDGPDPDAFMPRADVIAFFDHYVEQFSLPVQCNTRVERVEQLDLNGYRVVTPDRSYECENVVIATGHEQLPGTPECASGLSPSISQLHSSEYRNPETLPDGAVLVVGSAQSGAQIAEELYQSGRKVYLSVGGAGRAPRRYRGSDVFDWLLRTGFVDIPADKFPVPKDHFAPPHVTGKNGGHTLNLHQFFRDGVTLLGHVHDASGTRMSLAPDLHELLARADAFERQVTSMVDGFIQANGLDLPAEELPQLRDGFEQPIIEELDLAAEGISTVIWATGYRHDYGLVKMPVLDNQGFPIQDRGVTQYPGLAFVGMPWMPGIRSGTLAGVGDAARHVVQELSKVPA
jgi:putative flavoprotein involved in K+ transport